MTTKRDSKRKPKSDKTPNLKKETLKDLEPKADGEPVKGGKTTNRPTNFACN